ncbi:DUF1176 domain-containing protein [Tatumella terrea]|uniref:DUF1176 domain-containing protein n=1 Tax=Tatumella terrea TaxID=419007 RepID=A0ABW1W1U2_9GAMM
MKRCCLPAILFSMLVVTSGVRASEPVQRMFQDWQVTCNNLNDCDIRNVDENMRVVIRHEAGPRGAVSLDLMGFDIDKPSGIWLDGKLWNNSLTPVYADNKHDYAGYHTTSLQAVQAFAEAAGTAGRIALTPDEDDDTGSLKGLNTSLHFADEIQGRLNNRTAFIRTGNGIPAQVPLRYAFEIPATKIPAIFPVGDGNALINEVLQTQQDVLDDEECSPDADDITRSQVKPLDKKHVLVMINCVTGAYQSSGIVFIVPRAHPDQAKEVELTLPLKDDQGDPQTITWFTDVSYDPKTALLTYIARGHGVSDCGESGTWRYDGHVFQLMSYHNQPTCDGGEPGHWPSVWLTPGFKE